MLITEEIQEYFDKVKAFAKSVGKEDQLREKLDYLDSYACGQPGEEGYDPEATKCFLGKDFAPQSFAFCVQKRDKNGEYQYWFQGGLIFHGAHDGGGDGSGPTFSVCLSPTDGWSIHT